MHSKTILWRRPLDFPPPNGLNHYPPLNKTGAHSTGERLRATMALLLRTIGMLQLYIPIYNFSIMSGHFLI